MNPTILFALALLLALVNIVRSKAQDLDAWAIGAIALGLLWGRL